MNFRDDWLSYGCVWVSTMECMEGLIGQNYLPTKFGFCLGNDDFALVLLTLCVWNWLLISDNWVLPCRLRLLPICYREMENAMWYPRTSFMLNPIPNFNILSYLVAVFDLNLNFSNFPIATGKKCGSMCMFGCGANLMAHSSSSSVIARNTSCEWYIKKTSGMCKQPSLRRSSGLTTTRS